ncbi:MAG: dTDP-4-dehydrorhamnose 3,5-epimerase [Bacteroidetes bacterium]|jgi:dTDP-4-dehydrorhamnose 3,5-epimerase|nr:dTDP-4-dehydrorhamnose 3,5-epimerase [Bacteroidota bacterium]MDF1865922.1 dTDP-4-dehydrorhamnose 3,5-epimerase [Saprospiraceae bacterium]
MAFSETGIEGLLLFEPKIWGDDRGFFFESYNKDTFSQAGISCEFVQDNQSFSSYGVLRGLHYQCGEHSQSKMVSVLEGEVLDVVVDLREESKTYGKTYSVRLSRENKRQLFIPRRFAHGFVVLSETALFFYKCDNLYNKASEGGILFNDPILNIDWEIDLKDAILSGKDMELPHFGHHRIP